MGLRAAEHVQQAEGSMHGRGGEHTHPETPCRPGGSTAQQGGLREESKGQALDLGKTAPDSSIKAATPCRPPLVTK